MAQILYGLQPHSEKPLMMWLFETHAASQRLPLPKLKATYDLSLVDDSIMIYTPVFSLCQIHLPTIPHL